MGSRDKGADSPAHSPGTGKGEEITKNEGKESGREEAGSSHANRPAGKRTARDSTGINPEDMGTTTGGPEMPPA